MDWNKRTQILLETNQYKQLQKKHVLVAGLGGVGGMAAELLCRAGIEEMTIIDSDIICKTNRNRQLIALQSTTGKKKTSVFSKRLKDINPKLKINSINEFLTDENISQILKTYSPDYVIDAIDTLTPKTLLIQEALKQNIKVVSSMGSGAKFDPSKVVVSDIAKTKKCPLAKRLRIKLRKRNINSGVTAVYSTEDIDKSKFIKLEGEQFKKNTVGTISYMPAIFGIYCASEVIKDIINIK